MTVLENPLLLRKKVETGPYRVERSLRFNEADDTYLSKTFSLGDRRRWTWAGWIKRTNANESEDDEIDVFWEARTSASYLSMFQFTASGHLEVYNYPNSYTTQWRTTRKINDPNAWFHVCISCNGEADGVRIWVNGKLEATFDISNAASDNEEWMFNTANAHQLGRRADGADPHFNGYLADVHWIDGLALNAAAFGKFDSTGVFNTKEFALPAPNTGITWSGKLTAKSGSFHANHPVTYAFNGNLSNKAGENSNGAGNGLVFNPDDAFEDVVSLRFYGEAAGANMLFRVHDGDNWGMYHEDGDSIWNGSNTAWRDISEFIPTNRKVKQLEIASLAGGHAFCGAIEVNGVILVDGKTDPTTRNNPNNGTTWSGQISNSGSWDGSHDEDNMFDGSSGTRAEPADGALVTWTPASAISGRLRMLMAAGNYSGGADGNFDIKINDTSVFSSSPPPVNKTDWVDFGTVSNMTTFKFGRHSSGGSNGKFIQVKLVELDGHILIDGADDNSCHLKFNDISSDAALGTDSFGNGSWTVTNLKATDSSNPHNIDSFTDSPESYGTEAQAGGEVRGNYCVLNALDHIQNSGSKITKGGLVFTGPNNNSNYAMAVGTMEISSNDSDGYYFEVYQEVIGSESNTFGFVDNGKNNTGGYGRGTGLLGGNVHDQHIFGHSVNNQSTGLSLVSNSYTFVFGSNEGTGTCESWGAGDTIGIAIKGNKVWQRKNGTWYNSGDPVNGTNETITISGTKEHLVPALAILGDSGGTRPIVHVNFGQRAFRDAAPSGFKTYCSTNIPDTFSGDDVNNPSKYFTTKDWAGTGEATRTLIYPFSPDFLWIKTRANAGWQHTLYDRVRGAGSTSTTTSLSTNDTRSAASGNDTNHGHLSAFNSDGVTLTKGSQGGGDLQNHDGWTYISWVWDAGSAHSGANNNGDINISAGDQWVNNAAGFSITKYEGSGSDETVGHGLAAKPEFVIIKQIDGTSGWYTVFPGHHANTHYLELNTQNGLYNPISNATGDADPTNTVMPVGAADWNGDGDDYIMYAWTPIAGYSAFGYYNGTGNGSKGPFVNTGFKPRFIILKADIDGEDWILVDTERTTTNHDSPNTLFTNDTSAEQDTSTYNLDIVSNGFKIKNDNPRFNTSDKLYYWAAWAEHPFKTARAR